jgi:hypothetical protein
MMCFLFQWKEAGVVFTRLNSSSSYSTADVAVSFCDMSTCGRPKQSRQLMTELFQLEGKPLTVINFFYLDQAGQTAYDRAIPTGR